MAGAAFRSDIEASDQPQGTRYTFGDSDLAADRLAVVADVFRDSSHRFMVESAPESAEVAVDLGCGPGFTTHLLAEATRTARTTGLDNSESFLTLAGRTESERVHFRRHDVTGTPFPVPPAGVIYCRFLLTHLTDPVTAVARWTSQLKPGGVLLIDEVERVETDHDVLLRYQAAVTTLLSGEGQRLEIGSVLDAANTPPGVDRVSSEVVEVRPSPQQVGTMFHANLRSWRGDRRLVGRFGEDSLADLEKQLAAVAAGKINASARWLVRQISYRRT